MARGLLPAVFVAVLDLRLRCVRAAREILPCARKEMPIRFFFKDKKNRWRYLSIFELQTFDVLRLFCDARGCILEMGEI